MRDVGALAIMGSLAAGVWVVSQPPPPATTGELQFPKLSAPYTCSAGREGRVYYDMDVDTPYWCDDTNWVSFTGLSIAGTYPFMPRFDSTGLNIEDSDLRNTGVPAAGASGNILDLTKTLNAMDGTDDIVGLKIDLTNASHSGASNTVRGISPSLIGGGSANATETAYGAGSGWDYFLNNELLQVINANVAAGGSGTIVQGGTTLNAMNGSDIVSGFTAQINTATANHTGANNFVYGFRAILAGTPDADATYAAIHIADNGTEWDQGIRFANGMDSPYLFSSRTSGEMTLLDSSFATLGWLFKNNGTTTFALQTGKELTHLMGTDLDLSGTTLTIDPDANVVELSGDGSDTVSIITAPTSTSNTERVTFVCSDANVTFIDSDAAGAAGTINLAGSATNFVCSGDDALTMVYLVAPKAGNARWVEVSRSVN